MVMLQPLVGLVSAIAAIGVAAIVVATLRRRRPSDDVNDIPIANVHHADSSPVFRRLRRRYRSLVGVEVAALSVVGISAVGLTMRPLGERIDERDVRNRDVMLCLDVSGSMIDLDEDILASFSTLAAGLDGERIGLTIFNGSAVAVFPLTDDADYIASTLADSAAALVENKQLFVEGTNEGGSSLIGDGLASCVLRFDRLNEARSRSIVFATDNMRAGSPIMTLDEAGALAADRDIRVYAMVARHTPDFARDDLAEVVGGTDGASFQMTDRTAVGSVITEISRMEASRMDIPADRISDDRPTAWIAVCLAGVGGLAFASWRLRR